MNKDKTDKTEIGFLIKQGESKLSFLKSITPYYGLSSSNKNEKQPHKIKFRMVDGKLIQVKEGSDSRSTHAISKSGIDPDDLKKHKHLMRRQYFMDRRRQF